MIPSEIAEGALRFIRTAVPHGGCLLVFAESFFDETNTHKGAERLCLGGYIFLKDAAEQQAVRWATLIDKWRIPYFHMVECAHNTGIFSHLDKTECDLAAREAIQIIKDTASAGVCVTISEAEYLEIVPKVKFFGSAYDSCARDVMTGVSAWMDARSFKGHMHYTFEAGTETENNASWSIMQMMKDPELKMSARYAGHSFLPKVRSPGVQAADILAWHAGQDCKRALQGRLMRKDFESLCEIEHRVVHINRRILEGIRDIINSEMTNAGMTRDIADALHEAEKRLQQRYRS